MISVQSASMSTKDQPKNKPLREPIKKRNAQEDRDNVRDIKCHRSQRKDRVCRDGTREVEQAR